jgi:hypothetical protein
MSNLDKRRRPTRFTTGVTCSSSLTVGSLGNVINKIQFGTVSACVPATASNTGTTGSALIANLAIGDKVVMWPTAQSACGAIAVTSVCAISASCASMSMFNLGASSLAQTVVFGYITFS